LRYYLPLSRKAVWSQRIALLSFVAFIVIFALHRVGQLPTPLAMKLAGGAILGATIAVLLGFAAFGGIWSEGYRGAGRALAGLFFGAAVLAGPLWVMPNILSLPRIYEVSTDPQNPPAFDKVTALRTGKAVNSSTFRLETVKAQREAYPDIRPLQLNRPKEDAYSAVRDAVQNLSWSIVSETPPENNATGVIEATHRSTVFGFTDDMAIRVTSLGNGAKVDVRASARYGDHDLGRNAERVRELFSEVKTRLSEIDRTEAMRAALAVQEARRQKALAEKERQRIADEREEARRNAREASLTRESQISGSGSGGPVENQYSRGLSQPEVSSGRTGNRKQRQQARTRALRKFWEELNR
jgi:uncharacterized protein (DUF1499 family)